MSNSEKLIKLLESLKNAEFTSVPKFKLTMLLVESILEIIFKIEITKEELSEKDKKIIGPLIAQSLNAIAFWVANSIDEIDEAHIYNYKILRSGLEFLLDRYLSDHLKDAFKDCEIKEELEDWDQKFKNVNFYYDPNMYYGPPLKLKAEEEEQLPESHWWWSY